MSRPPNMDLPGLFGGGSAPRKPQRYSVRFPVDSTPCKHCPDRIVWAVTATDRRMPLSWKTREDLVEGGRKVGFTMEPHFGNCPGWPKRPRK